MSPSSSPVVTIFVRHSADCRYRGNEFAKRCNCRKHLRWSQNGTQNRKTAGTLSWAEAENKKLELEDKLAGRSLATENSGAVAIQNAIDLFVQNKKNQGVSTSVTKKYSLELELLRKYSDHQAVYTVNGITRELLTRYCAT